MNSYDSAMYLYHLMSLAVAERTTGFNIILSHICVCVQKLCGTYIRNWINLVACYLCEYEVPLKWQLPLCGLPWGYQWWSSWQYLLSEWSSCHLKNQRMDPCSLMTLSIQLLRAQVSLPLLVRLWWQMNVFFFFYLNYLVHHWFCHLANQFFPNEAGIERLLCIGPVPWAKETESWFPLESVLCWDRHITLKAEMKFYHIAQMRELLILPKIFI